VALPQVNRASACGCLTCEDAFLPSADIVCPLPPRDCARVATGQQRRVPRNNRSCSQAEKILQERDQPRKSRNTRKANREEACFPRISRIPRSIPPAFGCGFAALWIAQLSKIAGLAKRTPKRGPANNPARSGCLGSLSCIRQTGCGSRGDTWETRRRLAGHSP
jgi:hypothetical protein